jgi:hypothetical protein
MPRIKVDANGHGNYSVGSQISFALLSSPTDGRKQVRCFVNCRDYINDSMISFYNIKNNKQGNSWWRKTNPPIDTENLRLLIAKDLYGSEKEETLRERLYSAKRIINMYEEYAGFESRSVFARADYSSSKIKYCWVLTGPKEWMKSSHLVSMITLIFRVVVECGGFEEFTTLDEVEKRFNDLCTKNTGRCSDTDRLLPKSWPRFRMLMEYYDRLFGSKTLGFWHPDGLVDNWHSAGGIYSLCSLNVTREINEEVKKAWEDWKKEHPDAGALRLLADVGLDGNEDYDEGGDYDDDDGDDDDYYDEDDDDD